jgi:diadenosine tetraphosphate (Ap4A) HIT family hydrolase
MHDTLSKFGYPETVIHEGRYWTVLLRPQQATLGALVLVCNEPVLRYSDIGQAAFVEQGEMVVRIEAMLSKVFAYQRINYMMLMMVDPHVHFHVLPRYDRTREFAGVDFPDAGWPALPHLAAGPVPDSTVRQELLELLRDNWGSSPR